LAPFFNLRSTRAFEYAVTYENIVTSFNNIWFSGDGGSLIGECLKCKIENLGYNISQL
jgi:hypothetical protein